MRYVYVLVSDENDLYYEQALMAAHSFRLYMPREELLFLADDKTFFSLKENRSELKKYASKIIPIQFEKNISNIARSRLIKTSLPNYVEGEFLFIDCDTIVCDDLSGLKIKGDIAAVLDGHSPISAHMHKDYFLASEKKFGFKSFFSTDKNFNSGVIYCKNNFAAKNFFKKWNELWKFCNYEKKDHHDQAAFNEAIFLCDVNFCELGGEWNCQLSNCGLEFLGGAKIIHYFSSEFCGKNYVPYYKLADKNLQAQIKEAGKIPSHIKAMIKNPRFQFNKVHIVKDERIVSIMQSPLIFTLAEIKAKTPRIFRALERLAAFARRAGKFFLRKK